MSDKTQSTKTAIVPWLFALTGWPVAIALAVTLLAGLNQRTPLSFENSNPNPARILMDRNGNVCWRAINEFAIIAWSSRGAGTWCDSKDDPTFGMRLR